MLSQIERGVVSPSIDTLVTVCGVLGIDAAELFRRVSPAAPVRIHKRRERLTIENDGVRYEQLMTSHAPPFTAELFLLEVAPAYATALSHAGHEGVEIGYVLAGCGLLTVGTEEHAITEGDSVCFDARLPHRLASTGKLAFKAVWSISPPHVDYLK
jgi:mannose-6-phosphate isomerase-like protein (cupin superfamily)